MLQPDYNASLSNKRCGVYIDMGTNHSDNLNTDGHIQLLELANPRSSYSLTGLQEASRTVMMQNDNRMMLMLKIYSIR